MSNKLEPLSPANLLARRLLLCVAVLTAALISARSDAQTTKSVGQVEAVRGDAFADIGNAHRDLKRHEKLFVQERVGTGVNSRLVMHLGRDTTVRLGERAQLTIDRFVISAGGDITLQSGPMLFDRPARHRPMAMQIRSPYGLIAVRGTRFFAGPSDGVFGVFVARGRVTVSAAGQQVVLRAGNGTNIASPGAPPSPPAIWPRARIRAALDEVR